jgi:hypothetical protein
VKPGSSPHCASGIAFVCVIAICALTAAPAQAAINVPPGATEGDQYFEEVPTGKGSRSLDRGGGPGGGSAGGGSGGAPPVAATEALNSLGPQGQAAADLANSNRPPQGKAAQEAKEQPSSSTEGEGGMGALFPILLGLTALAAIAYGARRRLTAA